jgi:site-specific DNA-methyltransferase (adenine-specific)
MTNDMNTTKPQTTTKPAIGYIPCCTLPFVSLYNEDCIETMKRIPDGSIDLMLTDPPYNTTNCDWEYALNFEILWKEWERIIKPNGALIFTSTQPFTSDLIISNRKLYKYCWYWDRCIKSNFLNAKIQPIRHIETIVVFYKQQPTYNPILSNKRKDQIRHNNIKSKQQNTATLNKVGYLEKRFERREIPLDMDYPTELLTFSLPSANKGRNHPTEKPVDLMRYLILTYSNKGETVFDGYSGSGTTAEACMIEQRNFIGSELNKEYFDKSVLRLKNVPQSLF